VIILQAFFLVTALWGLDGPFVSTHFVRQNYTFDVAQHVFREGWSAVIAPKASFTQLSRPCDITSPLPVPTPPYTICHMEVPFYGLIGWPASLVFSHHERAIVRLIAEAFALLSIGFIYFILRYWLDPLPALLGTALWTTAPLILQFGQVPMPDILATTGMALAFLLAQRGRLIGSSGAFLFSLLAKPSVIIYGLPILVALVIARDCRSVGHFIRISLAWGIVPLLGLLAWLTLGMDSPLNSWVLIGGYHPGDFGPLHGKDLIHPMFYVDPIVYLFPSGCGVIGAMGLWFALGNKPPRMNSWLKASILFALACNYLFESIVWLEPQYTVPVLFWVIIAASLGLPRLLEKFQAGRSWRIALAAIVVMHVAVVCASTAFLKASRVPNLRDLETAGKLTPADARVLICSRMSREPAVVWLNRNTMSFDLPLDPDPAMLNLLDTQLRNFQKAGFDYILVLDVEAHHNRNPLGFSTPAYITNYTAVSSPVRHFFDEKLQKIFEGDHMILYRLPN